MFAKGTKLLVEVKAMDNHAAKANTAEKTWGQVAGDKLPGFEQLTVGRKYHAVANASGGVELTGDDGVSRHYGMGSLEVVIAVR